MPRSELDNLHTGSLLSRLQRLRECEESFELTDLTPIEITGFEADDRIHVKESKAWKKAYSDLKEVLARREHISTGAERKESKVKRIGRRGRM